MGASTLTSDGCIRPSHAGHASEMDNCPQGGGGVDPLPQAPPPPKTKGTIVGKDETSRWEHPVRGPFLVHKLLPPPPPPTVQKTPCPPLLNVHSRAARSMGACPGRRSCFGLLTHHRRSCASRVIASQTAPASPQAKDSDVGNGTAPWMGPPCRALLDNSAPPGGVLRELLFFY